MDSQQLKLSMDETQSRDLVMHTTSSNLDVSFSLIFFCLLLDFLFIDKEYGDNPKLEKDSLQFNKGSI